MATKKMATAVLAERRGLQHPAFRPVPFGAILTATDVLRALGQVYQEAR